MDPFSANGTPSRDVLLEVVKAQLDDDSRDQDFRRDVFLCMAVTIPQKQRARVKDALESLLVRARLTSSCMDLGEDSQGLQNDLDLAAELERSIGVIATLLVMGCEYISVIRFCDFSPSFSLSFVNLKCCCR